MQELHQYNLSALRVQTIEPGNKKMKNKRLLFIIITISFAPHPF